MSPQRIIGVILLIVGVALFLVGMNSSHSMADQLSNAFAGRFTDHTTWYIIGGIVVGIVGFSMMLLGQRGKNA
ncbi:MAG: DUF3185 family protein [Phycisphaerae bacterium]